MVRVKRKNGREEEFIREKIVLAIVKTGGDLAYARNVASDTERAFSKKTLVETEEIRSAVLDRLKMDKKALYDSWLSYDKAKK